jgi:YHS domain-containing protein
MKIILYSGDNVIETIEGVEDVKINGNDIAWETGSVSGVKCNIMVLNDDEVFSTTIILDNRKKTKIEELDKACSETILGRFAADINGVTYYFSNDAEAQSNFKDTKILFSDGTIDAILGGLVTWTCYDVNGNVMRVQLNKTQFDNVFIARVKHQNDNVSKFRDTLQPQVENATTVEQIELITW